MKLFSITSQSDVYIIKDNQGSSLPRLNRNEIIATNWSEESTTRDTKNPLNFEEKRSAAKDNHYQVDQKRYGVHFFFSKK